DGISFVQAAEGSMTELHDILHRVRELAVQFQNGTNDANAKMAITTEVAQLSAEMGRMISGANFNGVNLLDGSTASITLQVGANQTASDQLSVALTDLSAMTSSGTGTSGGTLSAVMGNFNSGTMTNVLADVDSFVNQVSTARGQMGAVQNRLEHTVNALGIYQENLMAAESRIRDVDMASEMSNYTRLQILQESGVAMLAQANQTQSAVLRLLG
ncbi:MAG: flagellin FliC, partial [Thermoleophilia bacterium]|nr:flagellin FliC [Thermoleophilia bacterium]